MIRFLQSLCVLFFCLVSVAAQREERLVVRGPEPGLVTLGSTAILEVKLLNPQAAPAALELPRVDGLVMRAGNWLSNRQIQILNGRRMSQVDHSTQVRIEPQREGVFEIPPFTVRGENTHQSPPLRLEVVRDLKGGELSFVDAQVSATRLYVGEPLQITLRAGVQQGLRINTATLRSNRERVFLVEFRAPWLEDLPKTTRREIESSQPVLEYAVVNGAAERVGYLEELALGGRTYRGFVLERNYLAVAPGTLDLDDLVLHITLQTGTRRGGLFGERQAVTEEFFNYADLPAIEIVPLPTEGRPADFSGAVGRFALDARSSAESVRVGDSIKLILTIRGQGNMETLAVPELGELSGYHQLGSNLRRERDLVEVTYDLTPLQEDAGSLPGVTWTAFDSTPGVERYVAMRTEPIPVRVLPLADAARLEALPGEAVAPVVPGVDDIFDIKDLGAGAMPAPPERPSRGFAGALLLVPWGLCFLLAIWFARRRRQAGDPLGRRARGAAREFERLLAAGSEPLDAFCEYLGARLGSAAAAVIGPDLDRRLQAAGVGAEQAQGIARAVEEGSNARYGAGTALSAEQARRLVKTLESTSLRRVGSVAGALLLGLVLLGTSERLAAQESVAQDAVEAYRSGDYSAAAAAYRAALAVDGPVDRRLFYNLGNALFRDGRHAEALWAYECARRGSPRDPELLANIALTEQRLELGSAEGESFVETLVAMRDSFTATERLWIALLANLGAAAGLLLGRGALRVVGGFLLLPALLFALEVLVWEPARGPEAIVLQPKVALRSEPRSGEDLPSLATLRAGVRVGVRSQDRDWVRVEVDGRSGYLPSESVRLLR